MALTDRRNMPYPEIPRFCEQKKEIVTYNVVTGLLQATVTDSEGLTGTETMTVVVGEPFSLEMSPESGKWVVGDTIQVNAAHIGS